MNQTKLLKLIEKNFKLIWKSKLFVLLILLGPLLLTLFLGMAFNNSKDYNIRVGVYSEDYQGVKENILTNFKTKFGVLEFDTLGGCINSVKGYETHICVVMPQQIILEGDEVSEVLFYVDNSRVNLVWVILDSLSEALSLSSKQLSTGMASDLLSRLSIAEKKSIELQKYSSEALEQGEASVILIEGVAQEIALLNLAETKSNLEESLKSKDSLNNDWNKIKEAANQGKVLLNNMSLILGNSSSVSTEISQLTEKLDKIIKTTSNGNEINNLGSLLEEAKNDFNKLEKNVETLVRKNSEVLILLKKLKAELLIVDGLVNELNIAVSNLKVTRADKIVEPIHTKIEPVTVEKTHLGFIFPTLVMLMVVFVSLLLSSSLIVMEKKNRAFFRNWLSRGWGLTFFLSYFITDLLIVLVDVFIFILIARLIFGVFVNTKFLSILILVAGVFVLLGEIIGLIAKNEQSNILIGVAVSSVLVFFSNTLIPIESASSSLVKIIKYNPFVIGERLLRKVLMPGIDFIEWRHDFLMILIYFLFLAIVLVVLSIAFYEKKFEIENWFKQRIWKKWKK